MRTKELIDALKKEDPSGELRVTINGEACWYVEQLPGYYDGYYQYVEKENHFPSKLYITKKDNKVVIHTLDWEDYIWDTADIGRLVFDKGLRKDTIDAIKNEAKKIIVQVKDFEKNSLHRFTFKMLHDYKEGWAVIRHKDTSEDHASLYMINEKLNKNIIKEFVLWWEDKERMKHGSREYYSIIHNKIKGIKHLCVGECEVIYKSGLFKPELYANEIYIYELGIEKLK